MLRKWIIGVFFTILSGVFAFLIGVYPDEIRKIISSVLSISDTTFVFYTLVILVLLILLFSVVYIVYLIYRKFKFDVIIQKDSSHYTKYPYFLVDSMRTFKKMSNTVCLEITVENCGDVEEKECEIEISLSGNEHYESKVLFVNTAKILKSVTTSINARHGTVNFYLLCLRLETLETFLPKHFEEDKGVVSGLSVKSGEYEIFTQLICNGRRSKKISMGNIKIPDDLLEKPKIPNDIQLVIDGGGFVVFLDSVHDGVRAKFYGHFKDDELKNTFQYLIKIPKIDDVFEDNGKQRYWKQILGENENNFEQFKKILQNQMEITLFEKINKIMSTEEMRKKRKIIYENAEIIKQGKDISEKLAETIDYVAVHHDRVAVLLQDKDDFRKKFMDWIGLSPMIKIWDIIKPYIQQDRIKRKNPKHVLYYEQLVNEYKKIKGIS